MFNVKKNSIKQLWHNLNEVCSFNASNKKSSNISKLVTTDRTLIKPKNVSNYITSYFATVGENLVRNLDKTHSPQGSFHQNVPTIKTHF